MQENNNLIPDDVKDSALHMVLKMFLNMQMRNAKALPPEHKWNYDYIRQTNREMIDGSITPETAIKKIWNWYQQHGSDTSFSGADLMMMAKRYGVILDNK